MADAAPQEPVPTAELPLDEAMELMHFAFRQVIEAPDRALAERGFSRLHHRILYVAAHNPGIVVGDVVGLLGVTKQAVHRPIRQLCEAELMTIEQGDDDRRTRSLQLTRKGRRFERRLAHMQHRIFRQAFDDAGSGAEKGWRAVMARIGGHRRLRV
jgi:DNA-binding MarR family transcriptional regulator